MMLAGDPPVAVELGDDDKVILLMGFGGLLVLNAAALVTMWGRDS